MNTNYSTQYEARGRMGKIAGTLAAIALTVAGIGCDSNYQPAPKAEQYKPASTEQKERKSLNDLSIKFDIKDAKFSRDLDSMKNVP